MHMKALDYAHASKHTAVCVLDDLVVPFAMHVCHWSLLGVSYASLSGHQSSPAKPCMQKTQDDLCTVRVKLVPVRHLICSLDICNRHFIASHWQ